MHCTDLNGFPFSEHRVPSGNLEFRFSGPGSIPNAVEQYNVLRGAELAELRRRKERKNSVPVFCKVRCPASDVTSMVTSRDVDVVTQLSLNESDEDDIDYADADEKEGIDASGMGNPVRLCGGSEAPNPKMQSKGKGKNKVKARKLKAPAKSSRKEQQHQQQRLRPNTEQNDEFLERLENLHLEVCAELQTLAKEEEKEEVKKKPSPRAKKVTRKQLTRKPNIRRLEGGAPQKDVANPEPLPEAPEAGEQVCYEDYFLPQPQWVDIMPSAMMSHGISVNVCACPAATPHSAYKFMEQYSSLEPESLTPFFREDSDLDHEFANRKGYLRYVEPRPPLDHNEDAPNHAEHHGSVVDTCFVEVERLPYKLSLLRSLTPMRYTSQCSELTQRPEALEALEPPSPPAPTMDADADADDVEEIALELQSKKRRGPRKAAANTKPVAKTNATSGKEGRVSSHNALKAASPPASPPAPAPAAAPAPTPRRQQQKRRKPCSLVVYSKSLENLKSEKLRIYNKISFTHERIIGAVDRLQISLLQLPPASRQRSVPEQERRQRNAFEFCVRFARNFLYPLKGMIDDVRLTPVASFNSAISNEASHRVMCVYGLMLQSLQNYQRHLRYFLLEKVAQKLSALIEMIYTMTNCCLDKNILARHDPVVESLLERCTRFLSFIEDLQQERIKLARETQRRRHHLQQPLHPGSGSAGGQNSARSRRSPQLRSSPQKEKQLRSHERYDLKMCLNDFKVYEPRVVPKERPRACDKGIFRRRRRTAQVNTAAPVPDQNSELQSVKDDVRTQMQIQAQAKDGDGGDDDDDDSTSSTVTVAEVGSYGNQSFGGASSPLREAMLEAVRRATPSQLQEVLNPMMRSLKMGDCQCLDK